MTSFLRTLAAFCLCATATFGMAQSGSANKFTLAKTTEVPGTKLHAGDYTIATLDSLADRTVMELTGANTKSPVLVLGVRANLSGPAGQPVYWDAKDQGRHALRGFVFADGHSVEFVYPKADAVALAKSNHTSVVAVDPASEGRPELNRLSSRDMQMVSLWMLTPTRVNGEQALAAQHYVPNASNASQSVAQTNPQAGASVQAASTQQASRDSSAPQQAPAMNSAANASTGSAPRRVKRNPPPTSTAVASASGVPAGVTRLPKTGSSLPLFFLFSGLSLSLAAAVRMRIVTQEHA